MAMQTSALVSHKTRDREVLILKGEGLSKRSLVICTASEDRLRRSRVRTAASRSLVQECRTHLASALGPIIRQKLRKGRLPTKRAAWIFGGPGAGGRCGACNRELRGTQLVMELPTFAGRVLFVHGDCLAVWDTERMAFWPTVVVMR